MAVVSTHSNHYFYQLGLGNINLSSDTLKVILMETTFAFDPDTHATLADVTTSEIAEGFGYVSNNKTITGQTWTEDDTENAGMFSCDTISFVASGGSMEAFGSAIIYDDTTSDDTVIGCIDFGADYTIPDGQGFSFNTVSIKTGGAS